MKKYSINTKYIGLLILALTVTACNDVDSVLEDNNIIVEEELVLPELTTGSADFSNYVALGASFTSGFTDGALFVAAQQNSFPNILSQQFESVGGGAFAQPLMNDNFGGLSFGGSRLNGFNPRAMLWRRILLFSPYRKSGVMMF